jgi:hypothetical protein
MMALRVAAAFVVGLACGTGLHKIGALSGWRASAVPGPTSHAVAYKRAGAEMLSAFPPSGRVAALGDSLIQFADWSAIIGMPVANLGISSSTTADIADRPPLGTFERVFVMVGINDLLGGESEQSVLANIEKVIQTTRNPIVVSLVTGRPELRHKVEGVNAGIRALCDGTRCTFVSLAPLLGADGLLLPQFTWDGIHLTVPAYRIWGKLLREHIKPPVAPLRKPAADDPFAQSGSDEYHPT